MNEERSIQSIDTPADPWQGLRAFTAARIALGRTGVSLPLQEVLKFRMAHAHARDAVYSMLDTTALTEALHQVGLSVNLLHSEAVSRQEYLQRPDKGRRLDQGSVALLKESGVRTDDISATGISFTSHTNPTKPSLSFVITDGLSAAAVNAHAIPLIRLILPMLKDAGVQVNPVNLVQEGRVAIGDEAGYWQQAAICIVLIGERPGLTSPDSLGIYLTWQPMPGLTDEARNCISNVRPAGLPYQAAADKLFWLIREALQRNVSGVALKDQAGLPYITG